MTQPTPEQEAAAAAAAAEKAAEEQRAAAEEALKRQKVRRGQVVSYKRRDPITDRHEEGVGVVLGVVEGGNVTIRPLAAHDVFVDPESVSPASGEAVGVVSAS